MRSSAYLADEFQRIRRNLLNDKRPAAPEEAAENAKI